MYKYNLHTYLASLLVASLYKHVTFHLVTIYIKGYILIMK